MAENTGIDFGQSSQEKYSIRGFLNKQETASPIAQDVAQAIQVASNVQKTYSAVQDEAEQHKYFNATIDFNNLKAQQQDALAETGNDLNAQRQVLDQYRPMLEGLSTKYELSDKFKATLGASVESHNSGWEENYRGKYNAQQKGVAQSNIAVVASTLIDVPKEDAARTMQGLKEYYKVMTGEDDRTAGINVFTPYVDSKLSSVNKNTMTLEQSRQLQKDILETGQLADPKIVATDSYISAKEKTDVVTEHFRAKEEKVLKEILSLGDRKPEEAQKLIDIAIKRGVVNNTEEATYLSSKYKEDYINKQATARNRDWASSNREISLMSNQLAYNNATPQEQEKTLLEAAGKNGWDKRQVMDEIVKYRKPHEAAIQKAQIRDNTNTLNNIKSNELLVKPEELQSIVVGAHAATGVVPPADLDLLRINSFKWKNKDDAGVMGFDEAIVAGHLNAGDEEAYKKIGDSKITNISSVAFTTNSPKVFDVLNSAIKSTNQVGDIPDLLAKGLNSADTTTKEGLGSIQKTIETADRLVLNNPEKVSALLGNKEKEFYLYKAAMLQGVDGTNTLTEGGALLVKQVLSQKIGRPAQQITSDNAVFKDNSKALSNTLINDKGTYDALCEMGMGNRKAIELINKKNEYLVGSNYNLSGIPETDVNYASLKTAVKDFASSRGNFGDKEAFITVKNNTIMVGTKDAPAIYSTGIPLKTVKDSTGKVVLDNNGNPLIGLVELNSLRESNKEALDKNEIMNAPTYKKGMQQFYYKTIEAAGKVMNTANQGRLLSGEADKLETSIRDTQVKDLVKYLDTKMHVDSTTLDYKLRN